MTQALKDLLEALTRSHDKHGADVGYSISGERQAQLRKELAEVGNGWR